CTASTTTRTRRSRNGLPRWSPPARGRRCRMRDMTTRFGSFRGRLVLTGYLFAVMIVYALSVTMIGPLMGALIAEYALSLSGGGLLLTFQSAGGIAAIVIGGAVADRMRKGTLVWICMFVYSVALTV